MSTKKFSAESIMCLKEALVHIYWKKQDIRSFITHTIKNTAIMGTIDWDNPTKRESINIFIDRMLNRLDLYNDDLLALFDAVIHFRDFSHLQKWDDSAEKIKNAKNAVEALRKQASGYFQIQEEKERAIQRKKAFETMQNEKESAREKLIIIKTNFLSIFSMGNPNERGFSFERFLNDFFEYYDLDPRRSFKITGEQIDGAFTFENHDYLVEAKWQQDSVNAGDLYKFAGKISGKLKSTLGLFISFNGFSKESLSVDSPGIKAMILMDGADIMAVLEDRIELTELLYRKRRHASETGNIFININDILSRGQ